MVFPALHGKNGEDGTVQGLLELAGMPYVGCGVLSSAVCMDKAVANTLMDAAGVPRCEWLWASRAECADFEALRARVEGRLPYPVFVKPANAGSSVGISKAVDAEQLKAAVATALAEDDKVVFERFVDGQEVECAVIGNEAVCATTPGEILASAEFYTYDDKYVSGTSRTAIPAHLSEQKQQEVRAWAEKAYRVLGCTGLARADFFVERSTGEVLNNWDAIKRVEKDQKTFTDTLEAVPKNLPANWRAEKLMKKASKAGFAWDNGFQAIDKLAAETVELGQAMVDGTNVAEELGDTLVAAVGVCYTLGLDPETVLHEACEKFIRRFAAMEQRAGSTSLDTLSKEQLLTLWNDCKP